MHTKLHFFFHQKSRISTKGSLVCSSVGAESIQRTALYSQLSLRTTSNSISQTEAIRDTCQQLKIRDNLLLTRKPSGVARTTQVHGSSFKTLSTPCSWGTIPLRLGHGPLPFAAATLAVGRSTGRGMKTIGIGRSRGLAGKQQTAAQQSA